MPGGIHRFLGARAGASLADPLFGLAHRFAAPEPLVDTWHGHHEPHSGEVGPRLCAKQGELHRRGDGPHSSPPLEPQQGRMSLVSGAYGFFLSFSTLLPCSPSPLEVTCHCVFLRRQRDGSRRSLNPPSLSSLRGDSFFRAKTGCAGATIPPPASERKGPRLCDWRSV